MSGGFSFESIFAAHGRHIFNFAYRITGDEGAAEDVAQETFLRAFRNLDDFREMESLLRTAASEDSALCSDIEKRPCVE